MCPVPGFEYFGEKLLNRHFAPVADTEDDIKICVFHHKPVPQHSYFANKKIYTPIQAGASCNESIPGMIGDDSGVNISRLNGEINESTAIYWVAKHYSELGNPAFVGFDHYRRYLEWSPSLLAPGVIFAHKIITWKTIREKFNFEHNAEVLNIFLETLSSWPTLRNFASEFDKYLNHHTIFIANCFITDRESFFNFWNIFEEVIKVIQSLIDDRKLDLSSLGEYNKRSYGFILERVTSFWIWKQSLPNSGRRVVPSRLIKFNL